MDKDRFVKKRLFPAVIVLLCLLFMGGICAGVVRLLLAQGQEVEVSVATSGDHFTESVTITVRNVLGMDILIDERERSCAMLQYHNGNTWEDVCEIRFVQEDSVALSVKYGGMYAHLVPGGELHYQLDGKQLEALNGGDYRIALRYISENDYINYLHARAQEIEASLDAISQDAISSDTIENSETSPSEETVSDAQDSSEEGDLSAPEECSFGAESEEESVPNADESASGEVSGAEVPAPKTQILYKEFLVISRPE